MDENDKARRYEMLMSQYITIENEISGIPKLSLEEQMKQVDATNKQFYNQKNAEIVHGLKLRLMEIQREAQNLQTGL